MVRIYSVDHHGAEIQTISRRLRYSFDVRLYGVGGCFATDDEGT